MRAWTSGFWRWVMIPALSLALFLTAGPTPSARADGMETEPPQAPPMPRFEEEEEAPRRDIHIGTTDHMRMGRDEEGNQVMEIRPRPKKTEQQPQVGPFYIYPQIGSGSSQSGQPDQPGAPSASGGQPGQTPPGGTWGQGKPPTAKPGGGS